MTTTKQLTSEQLTLPHVGAQLPPMAHAAPVLRFAGGKSWLAPYICRGIYAYLAKTGGRYCEPFFGGGAIGLHLGLPHMLIGDLVAPLMQMYEAIRDAPAKVAWALAKLAAQGADEAAYYKIRDLDPVDEIQAAAQMIYFNRLDYNGLMRFNRNGRFNVPYGRASSDREQAYRESNAAALFPSKARLEAVSRALATSELRVADFAEITLRTEAGDCVYADPPYYGVYDGYSGSGFPDQDQCDLADVLRDSAEHGVAVIATNADRPEVRELYSWATTIVVSEKRSVSQDTANRKRVKCLLVTNRPELVGT